MFHGHLDYFQKPPLGSRPITKPGDHDTPKAHNRWFIIIYHVRGPTWIETHWSSIWLRARSHMTSHYTRRSVTTLESPWPHYMILKVCWDGLWTIFFWALTIAWSRALSLVCEVALLGWWLFIWLSESSRMVLEWHATWTSNVHKPSYQAALEAPFLLISNWHGFNHGADIVTFGVGSGHCHSATWKEYKRVSSIVQV